MFASFIKFRIPSKIVKMRPLLLAALICGSLGAIGCAQAAPDGGTGKHVLVDKTTQLLTAFEGNRIVLMCRVSTGARNAWTPNGDFQAGDKSVMHYSTLFHHAPMPYSVEVNGNIFIHGFSDVPRWPASHGCIRVPLTEGNPARKFFYWVSAGTPIRIIGEWRAPSVQPGAVEIIGPLK